MTLEPAALFKLCNLLAVSGWAVLSINLARRRGPASWARWGVPGLLALLYCTVVGWQLPASRVDFGSLSGVQALFAQPWWLLAGWVHYLAFDLWVGAWQVEQAQVLKLPRPAVGVCLLLTFMFGPAGWLAFALLRRFHAPAATPGPATSA